MVSSPASFLEFPGPETEVFLCVPQSPEENARSVP